MADVELLYLPLMTTVISSLTPIRTDGHKLWKLLFQLSFSDDSPASLAVLRAMLSVASLYRYGHGEEPLRLKTLALESLHTSMSGHATGTTEIYQHVAVGMLLCAFETLEGPVCGKCINLQDTRHGFHSGFCSA
ncbi:fungal-specific transcription factor domain-containing protein [Penicillium concentricum]|uniref:Fungal-specific transcription factor domain-containing protein n=1 Tax=Penicillium concentricum TaxID=293559 RepID=A0A9W9VCQ3_9EURO|nr:fungal-specific transcription factor domain-containing protein [Penicillium concentricum]KAJ5374606.1 fungal-specific transcription factor domain-containing protein [Penicillium concentricum]